MLVLQTCDVEQPEKRLKTSYGSVKLGITPWRRNAAAFQQRSEEEVMAAVMQWEQHAHPRAREFFKSDVMLKWVFAQLISCIDRREDPVFGGSDACVHWHGSTTADDGVQATLHMVKPGDTATSTTYVNRVLTFIFANDATFDFLMQLPKMPFKMRCGNPLCVNVLHISPAV